MLYFNYNHGLLRCFVFYHLLLVIAVKVSGIFSQSFRQGRILASNLDKAKSEEVPLSPSLFNGRKPGSLPHCQCWFLFRLPDNF